MMRFAPGVWWYALPPALLAFPAFVVSPSLGVAMIGLAVGTVFFFRDPERTPPLDGVVSPADGRVTILRKEGDRIRVGLFMNVTDVHVNRAPDGGTVESVDHESGAHLPAFSKESERNEKVHVAISGERDYTVTLIAGAFARRITLYVEPGDELERGQRIGHIAFGSRADVLLPPEFDREDLRIEPGEKARAGETVIARKDGEEGLLGG